MEGTLREREDEQACITAALDAAVVGRGTALFFRGEPGLGKTALLALAAVDSRFAVVRIGGPGMEQAYPFALVQQVMESLPRACGVAPEELIGGLTPLRTLLRRFILSKAPSGAAPACFEVVYAWYWLLASMAERRPILLCLDDLHWSDPDSLEAVR
ncbi:MAG: ATP-binding protein [Peptococcaceae bacterium]|nr:ATP-binding protein [Peptococcaceae bacterium]